MVTTNKIIQVNLKEVLKNSKQNDVHTMVISWMSSLKMLKMNMVTSSMQEQIIPMAFKESTMN